MGIIRDSFVIFKNWADAINALPDEFQLETYKALVKFGTTGEIPEGLSQVANAMLVSFSVGMEKNITRYTASVENGKKGGRPKKEKPTEETEQPSCENENLEKPSKTQENQTEPTQNLYVHDNVNVSKLVKENKNINNYQARVQVGKARQPFIDQFADMGGEVFIIDAGWACPPGQEMAWGKYNGVNIPNVKDCWILASELGISIDELVGKTEDYLK